MTPKMQPRRPGDQPRGDAAENTRHASTESFDVDALALRVLDRLRELLTRPTSYSSRRGHGPAGYSDEAWKIIAAKIGTRRGRWWIVSAEALAAYEQREAPAPVAAVAAKPWSARDALESVGLHSTRRAS